MQFSPKLPINTSHQSMYSYELQKNMTYEYNLDHPKILNSIEKAMTSQNHFACISNPRLTTKRHSTQPVNEVSICFGEVLC